MNMKEACAYLVESRKARAQKRIEEISSEHGNAGFIRGFSELEARKALVDFRKGGKKNYNKGKKAAYNRIWRHYDLPKIK